MAVTITEKQGNKLKNKVKKYFLKSRPHLENGLCPTKDLIAATVDKWSMFVLFNLGYHKVLRFNELKKNIDGISSRMLSVTLKKLEKSGMVERNIFAEIPPKVEYSLTDFGFELSDKLIDLSDWFLERHLKVEMVEKG